MQRPCVLRVRRRIECGQRVARIAVGDLRERVARRGVLDPEGAARLRGTPLAVDVQLRGNGAKHGLFVGSSGHVRAISSPNSSAIDTSRE